MHPFRLSVFAATMIFGGAAQAADPLTAEVLHYWTSGSESKAARVLIDRFNAEGGKWVDSAIPGNEMTGATAVSRILAGNAPTAVSYLAGTKVYEFIDNDLLHNIDAVAEKGHWKSILPPIIYDRISRNGHVYGAPVNIHSGFMFYSKEVLKKSGVDSIPTEWDQFFPVLDKIKAAGFIPLAVGGQGFQQMGAFNVTFLSVGGKGLYEKIYVNLDQKAARSPEFHKVVETFGKLRGYADISAATGRSFNATAALLIANKAAFQFIADYAKGEFTLAGQTAGKEYGCIGGLKDNAVFVSSDEFVFPKFKDPSKAAAQDLLAEVVMEKEVQTPFSLYKGSVPVRTDVDPAPFDECAKKALGFLKNPDSVVPHADMVVPPNIKGQLQDVVVEFWTNPKMTADEMVEKFATALGGS